MLKLFWHAPKSIIQNIYFETIVCQEDIISGWRGHLGACVHLKDFGVLPKSQITNISNQRPAQQLQIALMGW